MEEVRSGHSEEPERFHAAPEGGGSTWHPRLLRSSARAMPTAVLSIVSPDGFPFAMRAPVQVDEANRCICIDAPLEGAPLQPGLACLTAHAHEPQLSWMENFQVRGDLVLREDGWTLVPHRLVGGLEAPASQDRDAARQRRQGAAVPPHRQARARPPALGLLGLASLASAG